MPKEILIALAAFIFGWGIWVGFKGDKIDKWFYIIFLAVYAFVGLAVLSYADAPIKCPVCVVQKTTSTCMTDYIAFEQLPVDRPFYDSSGTYHAGDHNRRWDFMTCSRGHQFHTIQYQFDGFPPVVTISTAIFPN